MKKTAKSLETPCSLGSKATDSITKILNSLVADAFALYIKTKNYHWHVSGPNFRDLHLLFDEQADQIFSMIDVLAERVRKVGGLTIHSIKEIASLQNVKDDNEAFVEPKQMLVRLLDENKKYASELQKAHKVCEKFNDYASTSVIETFIDETERRIWFLFETQI